MKRLLLAAFVLLHSPFVIPLSAAVPQLVNYQGRVAVGTVNFDGSGQFKFALVNAAGTTTYWSNDGTSSAGSEPTAAVTRTVTKGLYSVQLGDTTLANMTAVPASVFNNTDVRLRVWFNDGTNGFQLLTPDQRLTSVGFAMKAGSADTAATVPDGSITAAKLAPGSVGSAQIAAGTTLTPVIVAGTTQAAAANTSYLATSASPTTFTLPATANIGDTVQITGSGTGGWTINTVWTARESNRNWFSVASSADGSKLVAVDAYGTGTGGQIYTSTDSGVSWTARESNRNWLSVASSADGSKLVAVAYGGQIYTSTDSGVSWTARESNRNWYSVASSADGSKLVAAVYNGQIYTSTDSGVNWTARESNRYWQSVASSADGSKLVAGAYNGQIYTSTDSGVSWTARESNLIWWSLASSADGSKLVAVENGGLIYTSTDSGVNWTARESARGWWSVASSADGNKLVALVSGGQIYTSTDSGVSWTPGESNRNWTSVASSADGSKLVAVEYGGQIYTAEFPMTSGGQNSQVRLQYQGNGQWAPIAETQIAAGAVGSAQMAAGAMSAPVSIAGTTQAAAANTSYLATSASPTTFTLPATANIGDTVQITGSGTGGWIINTVWTARESNRIWLSVASSADGSKLVAVASGGQIYTSTDSGVSWTARESSRNWWSVASSSNGSKLVAVAYGGQIYTSTDSGVSWTARESNRYWTSVASSADGSKLVAGVLNGQIYTSTDSGVNWTARESNRQWQSVASSADGTKLVAVENNGQIYTSTDSGVSWTARGSFRLWVSVASSSDGTKLVAVEYGGQIYTSTDSGVSWTARESSRNWRSVASSADGSKLVAVENGGQIYTAEFPVTSGGQNSQATLQYQGNGLWSAVAESQIAAGAVGATQIATGAVGNAQLGADLTLGGTTTGTFSGNLTGNATSATTAGSATNFTGTLAGDVTGTQSATSIAAATVTGKALTGFASTTGTITSADTVLSAINKLNGNVALKAPLASPTFTGTVSGTFSGDGAGLTALNAGNISAGTLADGRLSANVALLNRATQAFTGTTNSFSGNVGIGSSTTPGSRLVVTGDATASTQQLVLQGAANPNMQLLVGYNTTDSYGWIQPIVQGTGFTNLNLNPNGGKVGIGAVADAGNSALSVVSATSPFQLDLGGSTGGTTSGKMMRLGYNQTGDYAEIMSVHSGVGFKNLVLIKDGGNLGIGTGTPTQAKLVVNGSVNSLPIGGNYTYIWAPGVVANQTSIANNNSIYASNTIWTGSFLISSSDERIKSIRGQSDSRTDLHTLLGIQITDYLYKDIPAKGSTPQKKVIAQQVEKVFPQAVSKQTDVVPDIFQTGDFKDGWVVLKTDLKKGERVRLTDDKTTDVFEVLEVADGKFRTAFKPEGDKVFVYGREVKDFRTVDYEAISMLNVSATQELARRLEAKDAEIVALNKQLADQAKAMKTLEAKQRARDEALEARLAAENAAMKKQFAEQQTQQAAKDRALEARLAALEQSAPTVTTRAVKVAMKKAE